MLRRLIGSVLLLLALWLAVMAGALTVAEIGRQPNLVRVSAWPLTDASAGKIREAFPEFDPARSVVRLDPPVAGRGYASLSVGFAEVDALAVPFAVLVDPGAPDKAYLPDPRSLWAEEGALGAGALLSFLIGWRLVRRRRVPAQAYVRPRAEDAATRSEAVNRPGGRVPTGAEIGRDRRHRRTGTSAAQAVAADAALTGRAARQAARQAAQTARQTAQQAARQTARAAVGAAGAGVGAVDRIVGRTRRAAARMAVATARGGSVPPRDARQPRQDARVPAAPAVQRLGRRDFETVIAGRDGTVARTIERPAGPGSVAALVLLLLAAGVAIYVAAF